MTINEIFTTIRDWAIGKFQPKGDYANSGDIPTKVSELENDEGFLTNVPEEYVTEEEMTAKGYLTEETDPTVPEWAKQPTKPTYSKAEVGLGNANNTSDISKPVSTAQQAAIDAVYQQSTGYTDQKIAELINGAPSTLDTLGEIAEAMQDNQDVVAALEQAIGTKADEADLNGHISNNTIHTSASEKTAWHNKMEKTGDASNTIVAFTQATTRANISSGEKLSVIMGKIMKFFADLKTVAFTGSYTDLSNKPAIPTASNTFPKANGTAAVGTETVFSRGDHVHPLQTTVSGNAGSATKLATARTIDGVNFNGSTAITHYGTCSTSSATTDKVVAVTGFVLITGAIVKVKFLATNTAVNPTLNVSNTGAKPIYYRGSAIATSYLKTNGIYEFVYNGNQWDLAGDIDVNMTAATANAAGKAGLVPAPSAGAQIKYLTGGATYQNVDDHAAAFTSADVADENTATWTSVAKLASGETHKSIFNKVSTMFKNVRYLYGVLGTTDISGIGGGTVTGAIDAINTNITNKMGIYNLKINVLVPNWGTPTTMTNLFKTLNPPCMFVLSTEDITDKPTGKYGTIILFKYSATRTGAICICTDGTLMTNAWNASSGAATGWK